MPDLDCPECPDSVDSRGAWTHLTQKHGWDSERAKSWVRDQRDTDSSESSRETPESRSNSSEPPDPDETAIVVEEEGEEKLSPDGFDSKNRPEMAAPEDADLPDGTSPDDFEPESGESASFDDEDEGEDEDDETPDPDASDDEGGGLMDRIQESRSSETNESDEESNEQTAQDIVDEADDEETRERRQQLLDSLNETAEGEESATTESETATSDPSASGNSEIQGALVNDAMLASVCTMPFHSAAKATGWEGWELDPQEREKLQKLIKQWADDKDIDLGPNVLLAMSLTNIVGSRAIGYQRHRKAQKSDSGEPPTQAPETSDETETDQHDRPTEETVEIEDDDESDSDEFDFNKPIGQ